MKIELKNIKFSEALSEETNAFTADLFVNGKKIGYCKNSGQGGCTDYNTYDLSTREVLKEAEAYAKTIPDTDYDGKPSFKNLEYVIDELLESWLKAKEAKKLEKHMVKGLLVETSNGYAIINWGKITIPMMLARKDGVLTLKNKIKQLQDNNEKILNTNLGDLLKPNKTQSDNLLKISENK